MVAPKDMSLEPVNVGGKDVCRCNKVKDLQVGPKSNGRYPYKKQRGDYTDTQRRTSEGGGRDWGMPPPGMLTAPRS